MQKKLPVEKNKLNGGVTAGQMEMLANRLRKRQRHLAKWARRCGVGLYRLYNRDIPEIPLVIDFYRGKENAATLSVYKKRYEDWEPDEALYFDTVKRAAADALGIDTKNIFLKVRRHLRTDTNKQDQYQKESGDHAIMDIEESGLTFRVNLSDYIDTGIFPDLRKLRSLVRSEAAGKRVLNLFCYSAAFSVYAAAGGAKETHSVDMSSTYLAWAKTNFALNGFSGTTNHLYKADAVRFIGDAHKTNEKWDMIILDPPAFSNSKKMKGDALNGTLDIKRDYIRLINSCLKLLTKGGKLFFSTGAKSFNPSLDELAENCRRDYPLSKVTNITEAVRDEDFKGRRMPLCLSIIT